MDLVKWAATLHNFYIGRDLRLLGYKSGMDVFIIEMALMLINFINIIGRIDLFMDIRIISKLRIFLIGNAIFWLWLTETQKYH